MEYKQRFAILQENKAKWLKRNERLTDESGIYILTRTDENGIHYAYIGQSVHVLTRLAEHLLASAGVFTKNTQWVDYSLRKHGVYAEDNTHGWDVVQFDYSVDELDDAERYFINEYAKAGYQLRNKTTGGQNGGKSSLSDTPRKGYYQGKTDGYEKARKEVAKLFEKNLKAEINGKETANKRKALEKFTIFCDFPEEIIKK